MSTKRVCLAVDLGANSGRVLAGIHDGRLLELRELVRFPNDPVKTADGWRFKTKRAIYDTSRVQTLLAYPI